MSGLVVLESSSVDFHVRVELSLRRKLLGADGAREVLRSSVQSHVLLEVVLR